MLGMHDRLVDIAARDPVALGDERDGRLAVLALLDESGDVSSPFRR